MTDIFKKVITNENIITNIENIPCVINCIHFFVKICNSFPSKIPWYIANNIFDIIINYFTEYFPKYDGVLDLIYLLLYTISIHNEGKSYIKNNLEKLKILFAKIFEKIENDENYFYYNLFVLKDLSKNELYSPFNALIHTEGISELIQIIYFKNINPNILLKLFNFKNYFFV